MVHVRRVALVALIVTVAAIPSGCVGAASAPPNAEASGPLDAPPSDASDPPGGGDPGGGNGVVVPPPGGGGGGGIGQPGVPEPVVPKPGQLMVHPVAVGTLDARVDGRHVVLNARWWSGVEPCTVLDSISVTRDGTTITVTLFEGTSDVDAACIAIAVEKVTVIDLGDLEPATYTIVADPGDAAIVVEVR